MNKSEFFLNISKGILRAVILTFIIMFVYSIIGSFLDMSSKVSSVVYLICTCLSIVYGAMYASKSNGEKGWICGIYTAAIYMLLLFIATGIFGGFSSIINIQSLYRIVLALLVGVLSGMLGINI